VKVNLIVLSPGKWRGKAIPVSRSPFLIGRGPRCQLRPTSPFASNHHCVLTVCQGRAFLHDLGSTNGTLLNGHRVSGVAELRDHDRLGVGPLEFAVRLGAGEPGGWRRPRTPGDGPLRAAAEEVAALLLSLEEEGGDPGSPGPAGAGVPAGATVYDPLLARDTRLG
jgi:pSer/pThr/pTyr-binding forkhead associated (FHA) protein